MLWLAIDFETTGLSAETERITEVGAVLWDMDLDSPVQVYSDLLYNESYPDLTPEIQALTGINPAMLKKFGVDPSQAFAKLHKMMVDADHLIAHNAKFDKAFYEAEVARQEERPTKLPWLCSRVDVEYPERMSRKLVHLAAEHGFLNPFAHRAVFDALTIFKVIKDYDKDEIIRWNATPNIWIRADVTFQEKDLAKQRGYHWKPEYKMWVKQIKEFQFESEQAQGMNLGFDIRRVMIDDD